MPPPTAIDEGSRPLHVGTHPRFWRSHRNDNYLTSATPHGTRPIWIDVRHEAAEEGAESTTVLRVCERGPGVPSALEPGLFRSFRRETTTGGGSGLGLSIVRQLAELNGGQTWYEPLNPAGSAFAVRLPTA